MHLRSVRLNEPILTTFGSKRVIAFYTGDGETCSMYFVLWNRNDVSAGAQFRVTLDHRNFEFPLLSQLELGLEPRWSGGSEHARDRLGRIEARLSEDDLERTSATGSEMSALPPKADMLGAEIDVR